MVVTINVQSVTIGISQVGRKDYSRRSEMKTTAEMDGWFGDPNDPERYQVYAQCNECGDWTFIQGSSETHGNNTHDQKCEHCGSSRLNPQSVTSKRTFDVERAKKRTALIKKEIEKRKQVNR